MRCRLLQLPCLVLTFIVVLLGGAATAAITPTRTHASSVIIARRDQKAKSAAPRIGARGPVGLARLLPSRAGSAAMTRSAAIKIPTVPNLPVLDPSQNPNFTPLLTPGLDSFASLRHYQYNDPLLSVEPPDPSLCVGGGKVIETVELAITIYDTSGNTLAGPTNLFTFFGAPNVTGRFGGQDFIGLVRCYYDSPTSTFFLVATDVGNQFGSPAASALLLAVMPAASTSPKTIVAVLTTDNGGTLPIKHRHCPCFEDLPLIGADANGIYVSGNEFPLNPNNGAFNGGQIYAFNKADLIAGISDPGIVVFEAPNNLPDTPKDLDPAASIQPAIATDGVFETANNGTEYFLSTLDFSHTRDNRIAVWALTNTCGIPGSGSCLATPTLTSAVLRSNAYGVPPNAVQENEIGYTPVGWLCLHNHVSKLLTFDDRMQQVIFAKGQLYSALTTVLTVNKQRHSGLLYFVVTPSVSSGGGGTIVGGTITDSQYVASAGLDLFYPAVAATQAGSAVMTFSMSGATMFPSAGYIPITADLGTFKIHTGVAGAGPYDGISGYRACSGFTSAFWGLNSAAVAENNTLWMATEYVSASCDNKTWTQDQTCGGTRANGSNWDTAITNLMPPGGP